MMGKMPEISGDELNQLKLRLNELEESEARLRACLESASQGVVAVDPAGTIVLVNAKTEDMFGYGRDELVGSGLEI